MSEPRDVSASNQKAMEVELAAAAEWVQVGNSRTVTELNAYRGGFSTGWGKALQWAKNAGLLLPGTVI